MKWKLIFSVGSKNYNLQAEVICTTLQIEQIQVLGDGISIILQNNRPLLEAIVLKRPLTWKYVSGNLNDPSTINTIIQKLENQLSLSGGKLEPGKLGMTA